MRCLRCTRSALDEQPSYRAMYELLLELSRAEGIIAPEGLPARARALLEEHGLKPREPQ